MKPGETVTLTYNIGGTTPTPGGLGAGLDDEDRNDRSTGFGDVDRLQLEAGQTSGTRPFAIPGDLSSGRYELTSKSGRQIRSVKMAEDGVETLAESTCAFLNVR